MGSCAAHGCSGANIATDGDVEVDGIMVTIVLMLVQMLVMLLFNRIFRNVVKHNFADHRDGEITRANMLTWLGKPNSIPAAPGDGPWPSQRLAQMHCNVCLVTKRI